MRRQLKFMSAHFDVVAVSSPQKELKDVAEAEGVKTQAVNMTRAITPLKDATSLYRLYRLLKKEKPDIVHTHTPKAGLLGMIAAKLAGVPVRMHTVAGMPLLESKGVKRRVLEMAETVTYRNATSVYPNSKNLAEIILRNGYCSGKKLKVIGNGSSNGIDTGHFMSTDELRRKSDELKRSLRLENGEFVYLFVGRIVKDKGIHELVAAFTELRKKNQNIRLLLVGSFEPELDPIDPQTEHTLRTDPSIVLVDFQQDVRPYYLMSDVLVFPSYREGFPNVPMQAGSMDLPSIVTNINGCNEIVESGKNGIIIPVKDAASLAEAMNELYENKSLYNSMKGQARKMIVDRYEQNTIWQLLLQEYNDQLKQHNRV